MAKKLPITALRVRERMEEIGCTQEALALGSGVSQSAISQILTGQTQNSRHMPKIAKNLAINLNWLLGLTDERIDMFDVEGDDVSEDNLAAMKAGIIKNRLMHPEQLAPPVLASERLAFRGAEQARNPDAVDLHEFDLAYGMGASFIHDVPVTGKLRTFSREWLRQFTDSPTSDLFFARGIGDSMVPTIQDADVVLIDTAQRSPRLWDKLWAVEMGGMGMIKRLRPTKGGEGMRMLSDAGLPEEVAYDGEMQVIGRVVAIVRKV